MVTWPTRLYNTLRIGLLVHQNRGLPFWPLDRIITLQQKRIRSIVTHAYRTVPFYQEVMKSRGLTPADFKTAQDLAQLPLIDGIMVRRDPERFLSSDYTKEETQQLRSGGQWPLYASKVIYWDNESFLRKIALAERDRIVLDQLTGFPGHRRLLYILPPSSTAFQLRAFWERHLLLPSARVERRFLPATAEAKEIAKEIKAFRPHVVYSYGSLALTFFHAFWNHHQDITLPKVWVYGGDTIPADLCSLIEKRFGCLIYSTYQATETGRIGFQCQRRQGFHLNIDLVAIRIIDDSGHTLPPGKPGEIVISNLHNRATVLLNYRLGDEGILSDDPCPCGRSLPLLREFKGRTNPPLVLRDSRVLSVGVLQMACADLLHDVALQSQVLQKKPGQVIWRLVPFEHIDRAKLTEKLCKRCLAILGSDVELQIEMLDALPPTPHGKQTSFLSFLTGRSEK